MKAFVLIWLGGLAVIGLVSVLYPASDTIINPTTYETVVQPVTVPSQPIDVSIVQRVTTQADALAVSVNRNEDAVAALSKRMDEITGKQAGISEATKALRVYVDEQADALAGEIAYESSSRNGVDILLVVLVALSSGLAIITAIELYKHVRRTKGGRVESK